MTALRGLDLFQGVYLRIQPTIWKQFARRVVLYTSFTKILTPRLHNLQQRDTF